MILLKRFNLWLSVGAIIFSIILLNASHVTAQGDNDCIYNPANGHCYKLTTMVTSWLQAEEQAVVYGGHLVTINDTKENEWLVSTFGSELLWIGYSDKDEKGNWKWVSGQSASYTNWFHHACGLWEPYGDWNWPPETPHPFDAAVLSRSDALCRCCNGACCGSPPLYGCQSDCTLEPCQIDGPEFAPGKWDDRHPLGPYRGIVEIETESTGMIVNVGSGRCLRTADDGDPVTIADCNGSGNQLFTLLGGTIRVYEDFCLDTAGSSVTIRGCDGRGSQNWALNINGLLVSSNNECAEVKGGEQSVDSALVLSSCTANKQSQLFKLIPQGTKVEQCFGAVGSKCEGILLLAPAGPRQSDGTQQLFVSVGSIAHDNCCLRNPKGTSCESFNSNNNWEAPCKAQWEKAVSDTVNGRQWRVTFGAKDLPPPYSLTHYTDNLMPATGPNRFIILPTKDGKTERKSLEETVSTRRLSAPVGTRIEKEDRDFCSTKTVRHIFYYDYRFSVEWWECSINTSPIIMNLLLYDTVK